MNSSTCASSTNDTDFNIFELDREKISELWSEFVGEITIFLGKFLGALVLAVIAWLVVSYIILPIVRRVSRSKSIDETLANFLAITVGAFLKLLIVMTFIDTLGIEVLSLAAFMAALGIGVGASLSGLLQNFMSGLLLIVQKPLDVGDYVTNMGDVEGTVHMIGLTHSQLKTPQRQLIFVPNTCLVQSALKNYNKSELMRIDTSLLLRHTESTELARRVFFEACAEEPRVVAWPRPFARVTDITTNGLMMSFRCFAVNDSTWWETGSHIRELIQQNFLQYHIEFQVPRIEVEEILANQEVDEKFRFKSRPRNKYRRAHTTDRQAVRLQRIAEKWEALEAEVKEFEKRELEANAASSMADRVVSPLKTLKTRFFGNNVVQSEAKDEPSRDTILEKARFSLSRIAVDEELSSERSIDDWDDSWSEEGSEDRNKKTHKRNKEKKAKKKAKKEAKKTKKKEKRRKRTTRSSSVDSTGSVSVNINGDVFLEAPDEDSGESIRSAKDENEERKEEQQKVIVGPGND